MGKPKMMCVVTIGKELVEFRFFDYPLDGCPQLLLIGGYGNGIDYPYKDMGYLVRPVAYDTFYFSFHICDVLVIVAYAVALILYLINLRLALTRLTIWS